MSERQEGVSFSIARMSFARRMNLLGKIREIAARRDFTRAGTSDIDKLEGAVLSAEIDQVYVEWGLREIHGLTIDGAPATPETLIQRGPEDLFHEALKAVKAQCGLDENERKN